MTAYRAGVIKAIRDHAEAIRTDRLKWRRGKPISDKECCIAYVNHEGHMLGIGRVYSYEVHTALIQEAKRRGTQSAVVWNDLKCEGKDRAVEFLEAAAKAVEEGRDD